MIFFNQLKVPKVKVVEFMIPIALFKGFGS